MTRLGRSAWWAVAAVAVAGLLLSLVTVAGAEDRAEVAQVRGSAAASAPEARTSSPRGGDGRAAPETGDAPTSVARDDASLGARPVRRTRPPTRVRVPSLGLDVAVRAVGVGGDRQMSLPDDPAVMGWYRFGAGPGERGSVVLAGHVDSRRFGVGPLAELQAIGVGDRVEVSTAAGGTRSYRVDSIERFDRQALPDEVFSRSGPERLRLVTCTGPYVPEAGGYQQNLVVTAVPV